MALRPWQAQENFCKAIEEVKAPTAIKITPQSRSMIIEWQKRPGKIDGFVIILGTSVAEVQNTIPSIEDLVRDNGFSYCSELTNLKNGQEYFVTIIAIKGTENSGIKEIWKVVPNIQGKLVPAESVPFVAEEAKRENLINRATENNQVSVSPVQPEISTPKVETICPSCSGDVILDTEEKLFVCQACHLKYVQRVIDGAFINISLLVNGVCQCCDPRRPIIFPPGAEYKQCSSSGEKYTSLGDGGLLRISSLDYGLCQCCQPPRALILNHQSQVVCSHNLNHLYIKSGEGYVQKPIAEEPSLVDEIDAALADGSAVMLPGGILTGKKKRKRTTQ